MKTGLEAVSFDCYGTLIDWETGITECLIQILRNKKTTVSPQQILKARGEIEFKMIQGIYRSYSEILHDSLKQALSRYGVEYEKNDGSILVESVPQWPVFHDTAPALKELGKRYKLAIISNIDNAIIEKTKLRIGIPFDLTVTAEQSRAYKPSLGPFQAALESLGCEPGRILHVSSDFKYDIPPARRMRFRTAWVNRKGEPTPEDEKPDFVFRSLTELAERLRD